MKVATLEVKSPGLGEVHNNIPCLETNSMTWTEELLLMSVPRSFMASRVS